jgi:glycosyltransferase involved in cell wall biosynthesis
MSEGLPLISVIVPTYNQEDVISRCARSILAQTYHNLEIILVDDGSTDKTGDICDAFARENQRVHVIHKENGGTSDARNAGLAVAKGDFIGFVDGDDYIAENMYETLYHTLKKWGGDIVECTHYNVRDGEIWPRYYPSRPTKYSGEEALVGLLSSGRKERRNYIKALFHVEPFAMSHVVWSKLYSRNIVQGVKFKSTNNGLEDTLYNIEIMKNARTVVAINEPLYYYVFYPNSLGKSSNTSILQAQLKVRDTHYEAISKIDHPALNEAVNNLFLLYVGIWSTIISKEANPDTRREICDSIKARLKVLKTKHEIYFHYRALAFILKYCPALYRKGMAFAYKYKDAKRKKIAHKKTRQIDAVSQSCN